MLFAAAPPPQPDLCTIVAVQTIDPVNSAKAHPGDFFRFKTINDVTDRTHIIIPARTVGWGIVTIASPAGRGGRAGTLVLEPRYLVLPDGRKLGVVLDHKPSDLAQSGASNSLPGYLGAIPVPGFGAAIGAFNYFHHGKDITVPRGTLFAIFPSDDPKTARCQTQD
ncbi:MAG: hypothetical protein JO193_04085 [Candidatus Eremiobacteraeota bacterium]|nr:hypothetical protein [Candidatus Eremiobacteraeota bacterium]MBV9973655.1 hypothetical protein [Candidatus Eremiobacteraeota bacterium]